MVAVHEMGLAMEAKTGDTRDPGEESLEDGILAYFDRVLALLGSPCPPRATCIKKSLMKTYSLVFPNHETNEKLPYDVSH